MPAPPLLEARTLFDGYRIVREIHGSSRSHIYLAVDTDTQDLVAMKIPSIDLRDDPAYLKRFMMEEWVARRIDSPHVLKPCLHSRKRNYLYVVMEFIDGQTLTQWMIDHPRPDLETVRGIIEQIARGLRAFHRKEMLHQDLRPDNIMIDKTGTAKIIDFGSTRITGVAEAAASSSHNDILGTAQYTAPEYFLGESGSPRSDMFSLGVISYQMLTGKLPYGAQIAKTRTRSQLRRLRYSSALDDDRRNSGMDRRGAQKGRASRPRQALREPVGIHFRSSPPQSEIPQRFRHSPDRAQPDPVLEMHDRAFLSASSWDCSPASTACVTSTRFPKFVIRLRRLRKRTSESKGTSKPLI